MISSLFKKKLSDNQLANVFVNGVMEVVDNGFSEVAGIIKEDPAFTSSPIINDSDDSYFTMIVIVGNLDLLDESFDHDQSSRIETLVLEKFASIFELNPTTFKKHLEEYRKYISRVNHPSKNMLYGMSKAMFHKYSLNQFQDDYFKKMQCPNPLFLKRMDEVMNNFLWNWEAFFKRYKMAS